MNIEEYISSGIIEDYVLGQVTDQQLREVDCLRTVYPEINEAIVILERDLVKYAISHSIKPDENVKSRILAAIENSEEKQAHVQAPKEGDIKDISEAKTDSRSASRSSFSWMRAAAVALPFILISILIYFYMDGRLEEKNKQLTEMQLKIEAEAEQIENLLALISNPQTKKITLNPVNEQLAANAIVYWNSENKSVFIDPTALPGIPSENQYQLWAIVSGKPVSLGVFETGADLNSIQEIGKMESAEAFAITMEVRGGSETPSMDQMVVMAAV